MLKQIVSFYAMSCVVFVLSFAPTNPAMAAGIAISGQYEAEVAENTQFVVELETLDDSEQAYTFALRGDDAALFEIQNGVLQFIQAPNFESPLDSGFNNNYQLRVNARDSEGSPHALDVLIEVTNVNDAPIIVGPTEFSVRENQAWQYLFDISDDEREELTISLAGADAQWFQLVSASTVELLESKNFETPVDADLDGVYELQLSAVDESAEQTILEFTVSITDVKEPSHLYSTTNSEFSMAELDVTQGESVALFSVIEWQKLDGSAAGDVLVISGLLPEDEIVFEASQVDMTYDSATGEIFYEREAIAVLQVDTESSDSKTLNITFLEGATAESAMNVFQALFYTNSADIPTVARELQVSVLEGEQFVVRLVTESSPEVSSITFTLPTEIADKEGSMHFMPFELSGSDESLLMLWCGDDGTILTYGVSGQVDDFSNWQVDETELGYFASVDVGESAECSAVDIDGDDDFDLFVGAEDGYLYYFRNDSAAEAVQFSSVNDGLNPLHLVDVETSTKAVFLDIDMDFDADVFLANGNGEIRFLQNIGDETSPTFVDAEFPGVWQNLSGEFHILVIDEGLDGDQDLLVSDGISHVFYQNQGTAYAANFVAAEHELLQLFADTELLPSAWGRLQVNQTLSSDAQAITWVYANDMLFNVQQKWSWPVNIERRENSAPHLELPELSQIVGGITWAFTTVLTDAEGDPASVSWQQLEGVAVSFDNASSTDFQLTLPDVSTIDQITLRATTTDGRDESIFDYEFSIYPQGSAIAGFQLPRISMQEQALAEHTKLFEFTADISDADGQELDIEWQISSGEVIELLESKQSKVALVAPSVTQDTEMVLELTVTDGIFTVSKSLSVIIYNPENSDVFTEDTEAESDSVFAGLSFSFSMIFTLFGLIWIRLIKKQAGYV